MGSSSISEVLQQVLSSSVVMLDRWAMACINDKSRKETKKVVFNNYFGVGIYVYPLDLSY